MFEWITEIDHGVLLFIQEYLRFDWLTPFVKFISSLGNAGFFWILLSVGFLCFKKTRKAGFLSLLSLLLCFLVTNVALKNIIARMRPYHRYEDILLLIVHPGDFSFPSGHSASAFAAAGILFHYIDQRAGIGLLILASAIALSRLYLGVHYPTDVFAGICVGLMCSFVIYALAQRLASGFLQKKTRNKYEN